MSSTSSWFKERLGLDDLPFFRTPDYMYNVNYWLGALVAGAFIYAVISGLFLLLYYYPSDPYGETWFLILLVPYGSVVLFSHLYSSYAMIILAYIHMFRNYFSGAYKKPREIPWVIGVLMLVLTLAASFVGYSLIADVLGVDAVDVGRGILNQLPGGGIFNSLFFGNGTSLDLYTRLLAWHIILVAAIGMLFVFHFFLAEKHGIMPARREKPTVPAVYSKEEESKFNPWWPRNFVYMLSLLFITWGFIIMVPNALAEINGLPLLVNPHPAPSPTSPMASTVPAYPPWFFLFFYKIADFLQPNGQPYSPLLALIIAVAIPLIYLIALPFMDRSKYLTPWKRKLWIWIGILMITYLIETSVWGYEQPGVPEPFLVQAELYLPPAIIAGVALYLIRPRGSSAVKKASLSPLNVLALTVLALLLVGTLGDFISDPTVFGLGILIPLIMATVIGFRSVNVTEQSKVNPPKLKVNRKIGEVLLLIILILSVLVASTMWTLPSLGPLSNLFGVELGILFILLGEALSLYHHLVFVK
ncbi:cytochrome b6 [Sulfolobales archaeon HS-7]|nr:cytochrome b6 [Sulfolobales archaeon HS-7]